MFSPTIRLLSVVLAWALATPASAELLGRKHLQKG